MLAITWPQSPTEQKIIFSPPAHFPQDDCDLYITLFLYLMSIRTPLNELRLRVVCFSIPKINLFQTSDSRNVSYKSLITFGYKARLVTIATASPYELHSPPITSKVKFCGEIFIGKCFMSFSLVRSRFIISA